MNDTMKKELTVEQLFELVLKDYRDEDKVTSSGVHNSMKHWERLGYMKRSAVRLATSEIEEYKTKRRDEGASKGTVNIELSHLRRGYTIALERELIHKKPVIKTYYLGNTNRRLGWFEQGDYDKLMPVLKHYQKQCLRFSYICGWRQSELFKLTWKDNYDEDNQCIRIYKSKKKDGRVLPLIDDDGEPTELYDIIEEQKTYRSPETDFIFHYKGEQINKSTFHDHWTTACEQAGVKRHFHDLRRTASRNLRNAGVDQAERMAIIGHKTTTMDLRYGIVNEDDIHRKRGAWLERVLRVPELFQDLHWRQATRCTLSFFRHCGCLHGRTNFRLVCDPLPISLYEKETDNSRTEEKNGCRVNGFKWTS